MSFFRSNKGQKPNYTGLQIQTAANTLPIPILYGINRLAPNALWYNAFQTLNANAPGGKGNLFAPRTSGVDYRAAIILALCEGPITAVGAIWKDQSLYSLATLGLSLFDGATPQSVWSYLASAFPNQALAYQGTAFVCASNYDLGPSATVSNHNFEIYGILWASGANGVDADPAQVVNDFLTNAQYGVGFPSGSIDATTLFGSGGDASYQTYCKAVGLCFSPCLVSQESAQSILSRWLQLTNTAAVWSGGKLKFIPYGDTATSAGALTTQSTTREIGHSQEIWVCNPSNFVADQGVVYAPSGVALTFVGAMAPSAAGTYGMITAGVYLFAAADFNTMVKISFQSSVAASYVPNLTPVYALTDDDIVEGGGEDPIKVTRSDPYQSYNVWRLEITARDTDYAIVPVEARDQDAIERYGLRVDSSVSAHEICDEGVGATAAQLMLQRALYVRNTFRFKLSWEFCLLDPMDIIEITDANLGYANYAVRITEIEEADDGTLSITAEELSVGVGTTPLYPTQGAPVAPINRDVAAAPVNTPIIFEPTSPLISDAEVWMAVSGGTGGVADPNWGGCNVYLSLDNASYSQVGVITQASRMGVTSASLAAFSGANPDNANTLAVDTSESAGVINTATMLDAGLATTLCIVDGELLSYATSTLTSAGHYSLTGLYRGLYGTTAALHASGTKFARLDNAIFKYALPASYVGRTLYVKLQSFNVFGGGLEDISTCTVYTYVPTGEAFDHPVARSMLASSLLDFGSVADVVAVQDDFGTPLTLAVEIDVDLGVV